MTGNFSRPPTQGVPLVHRPYLLGVEALGELADDRLNPTTHSRQARRERRFFMRLVFERGQQREVLAFEFTSQFGTPVVTISQDPPARSGEHLRGHCHVACVGRGQLGALDHAGPEDRHVSTQAVERLVGYVIVAEGCFGGETSATRGAPEAADQQAEISAWEAVNNGQEPVATDLTSKVSQQVLFDAPQVGRLPRKRCAANPAERGKERGVMLAEVGENAAVGVVGQEFADEFTSQDHAIGHRRSRAALAQPLPVEVVVQKVVGQAEHRDDVVARVSWQAGCRGRFWIEGLHLIQNPRRPACSVSSKKLAHAVT